MGFAEKAHVSKFIHIKKCLALWAKKWALG